MTRVGNWNEDTFLADEVTADFEKLKAAGGLKHQRTAKLREEFYSEVATSPHGDKGVCLGDVVMVKNLSLSTSVSLFSDKFNENDYIVTGMTLNRKVSHHNITYSGRRREGTDSKHIQSSPICK